MYQGRAEEGRTKLGGSERGSLGPGGGRGGGAITLPEDGNAEKERCPGRASAQLGRHCGPHNTARTRGTGDPREACGGVTCKRPWRRDDREAATNTLGGGVTTSPMGSRGALGWALRVRPTQVFSSRLLCSFVVD